MTERHDALPAGAEIEGYRIDDFLGAGGFGITYRATEMLIDRPVVIKEYLPVGLGLRDPDGISIRPSGASAAADYEWGLARFRDEAKTLVSFRHPNIVPVLRYFEIHGTGYMVMDQLGGQSLFQVIASEGRLPAAELERIIGPLLDGIEAVHKAGFLHRDIKPDNILLTDDGAPVLIDFGSARLALGEHSKRLTAIVSEGYSPFEQYWSDGNQGPWTDIYALGATIYRCISGKRPPSANSRLEARMDRQPDPMAAAVEVGDGVYDPALLRAVDAMLEPQAANRPQSVADVRNMLARPVAADRKPGSEAPTGPTVPPTSWADLASAAGTDRAPDRVPDRVPDQSPDQAPVQVADRTRGRWRRLAWAAAVLVPLLGAGAATYVYLQQAAEARRAKIQSVERLLADAGRLIDEAKLAEARRKIAAARTIGAVPDKVKAALSRLSAAEAAAQRKRETDREREKAVALCDRLAANPLDPLRQAQGVPSTSVTTADAIPACRRAIELDPDNARMHANLGRAANLRQDYALAVSAYREAAKRNYPVALSSLGWLYYIGRGVDRDWAAAERLFRRAVARKDIIGPNNLGWMYYMGAHVKQDYGAARGWFDISARRGYNYAQYNMHLLYRDGRGVVRNDEEAYYWLSLAVKNGLNGDRFQRELTRIGSRLSAAEKRRAAERVAQWRATPD